MKSRPHRLALVFAAAALAAAAAAAPAFAEEPEDAAPADPKVKVTAFALSHPGVTDADVVEIVRAIENGLKKNARLEMKDLDTRLADFANETPNEQIDAARALAKDGQQALAELRIPDAVMKLSDAVTELSKVLPYIKKQELADVMASLAIAQYEGGDKTAGLDQFVELLTFRPDYEYDTKKFPPRYASQVDDARRQVEGARKAPIGIASDPPGAQAYVDGKYIGVTPCVTEPLPAGRHFVTFKKEGYKKAVQPAVVPKKGDASVSRPLERNEKYLLVEQARTRVEQTMGEPQIDPEAETLKTVLFIEQAVFLKAAPQGDDKIAVDAYLYDLRTRQRLSKVRKVAPRGGVEGALAALAGQLYQGVNYEGELAAPEDKPPPVAGLKPWYKKAWVWGLIGAGVVLAGAGVGTYFAIDAATPASCPEGLTCLQFGP